MNRTIDRIRICKGVLLLSNVLIFFLPTVSIWQENYPEQVYSQLSLIQGYLISGTGVGASPASGLARFMSILFVLLPLILAIYAGVCCLIEKLYGKYARIAGLSALCLYLCQFFGGRLLWPRRLNDAQQYNHEIGWWLFAVVVYLLLAIQVIFWMKSRQKAGIAETLSHINAQRSRDTCVQTHDPVQQSVGMPSVPKRPLPHDGDADGMSYTQSDPMGQRARTLRNQALSQTQTEINLALETVETMSGQRESEVSLPARGVMVGIAGVFAGKEVAFRDEETLHLGRDLTNDLVFTHASHISRNHCSITWYAQKQKYFVEDRSSNGCFINGAPVRLPKNVEIALDPGTVIDIGDRTNRFRLE